MSDNDPTWTARNPDHGCARGRSRTVATKRKALTASAVTRELALAVDARDVIVARATRGNLSRSRPTLRRARAPSTRTSNQRGALWRLYGVFTSFTRSHFRAPSVDGR